MNITAPQFVFPKVNKKTKSSREYLTFAKELSESWDLHHLLTDYLWTKGIVSSEMLEDTLSNEVNFETELFSKFKDLQKAAKIILEVIKDNGVIIIYGDYDADGITATAVLWKYIYHILGHKNVFPFIPDRKTDGYGLKFSNVTEALEKYTNSSKKSEKIRKLLITVDCGIRDEAIVTELKTEIPELQIIISDHHSYPETTSKDTGITPVPSADALVHPQHTKHQSNINPTEICGAVVSWCITQELLKQTKNKHLDDYWGIEYATIGTICDLMPLTGINRKLVKKGLAKIENTNIIGIKELLKITGSREISSETIGYQIGPRINAAGRIGDPLIALKLLVTNNHNNARILALELEELNKERQKLTYTAISDLDKNINLKKSKLLIVYNEDWEEGIIGLIAGKLQRKYWRPAIALTKNSNNQWVGSGRSNPGINITKIINSQSGNLVKFGGHSQAAGLTVTEELFESVISNLQDYANNIINGSDLIPKLEIDLDISNLSKNKEELLKLNKDINKLQPFGKNSEKPTVYIKQTLEDLQYMGKMNQHSKGIIGELELLMFNQKISENKLSKEVELVGNLGVNEWRDRKTPQIILQSIK